MKANYTHIQIVLDASGSMQNLIDETIGGINNLVAENKKLPGTATLGLIEFSSSVSTVYSLINISNYQNRDTTNYVPNGYTALYDAICIGIDTLGDNLNQLSAHEKPEKVLFVIITDGYENASKQFKQSDAKSRITHQTERYNWEFVFMGCNQDAVLSARELGISKNNALTYDSTSDGTRGAWKSLSVNAVKYRSYGASRGAFFNK